MKAFFLTIAALVAYAGTLFAQNLPPDYNWEVGINGGLSVMTRPLGPALGYQGNKTNVVHDYSLRLTRYFNEHLFMTFDLGDRQWQSYGQWTPTGTYGQTLPTQQITYQIANQAITESFELNYTIPFYTDFHTFNRSNLYFGVMLGLVTTVSDGSLGYSKYPSGADSGSTFVSKYDYGMGVGFSYGLQIGYTYYIVPRLGINVELAARYAGVETNNTSYAHENSNFSLLYFPETVGLRWRF